MFKKKTARCIVFPFKFTQQLSECFSFPCLDSIMIEEYSLSRNKYFTLHHKILKTMKFHKLLPLHL